MSDSGDNLDHRGDDGEPSNTPSDSGENTDRPDSRAGPSARPSRLSLRGAPAHMRESIRRAQNAEVCAFLSFPVTFLGLYKSNSNISSFLVQCARRSRQRQRASQHAASADVEEQAREVSRLEQRVDDLSAQLVDEGIPVPPDSEEDTPQDQSMMEGDGDNEPDPDDLLGEILDILEEGGAGEGDGEDHDGEGDGEQGAEKPEQSGHD